MTRVTLYTDEAGAPLGFSASDHCGFAKRGDDVVCAAVSILSFNTINAIECLTGEQAQVAVGRGSKARISCLFDQAPGERARLLLDAYAMGVRSIREEYGDYLRVTEEVRR